MQLKRPQKRKERNENQTQETDARQKYIISVESNDWS